MKKWGGILIILCLLGLVLAQVFLAGVRFEKLVYLRAVDGDTFWVRNLRDGSEWKVRLWGVDAPEPKECYFEEAKERLDLELSGKKVAYERYGYDGYGRILAKVTVNDRELEEILVAAGMAKVFDAAAVHDELKPEALYLTNLKIWEEKAKAEKLGVWSTMCL